MFVSWSTHQEALDTIKNLRLELEDEQRARRIIREDLEQEHKRDNFRQDQAHQAALIAKDNKIATLENQIERMESEMEARLKLQEDIHLDELLAVEAKFEAQKAALEITKEAELVRANARHSELIARAEREGAQIIRKAQESVQGIYTDALSLIVDRIKNIPTMSPAEITDLIKAATENYPTLPTTLTSSSK